MKKNPIDDILNAIQNYQRISIASHLRPDGDSICTSLALSHILQQLGKQVSIYIKDRIPFPCNHYPDINRINIGQIPPTGFDCVFLLECANVSRSGQESLDGYFKINIDHHHSNDYYGDINWVEPDAAAVACLVYQLGVALGVKITPQIATQLYSAIVSDTGSFQFSNTSAQAFKTCHELLQRGVQPYRVTELLYNNNPPEKIKLLGLVLSTLQMKADGEIVMITMYRRHLDQLKLREIDTEEITTLARSVKDARMVLFFKEVKSGVFRVSVRSKGKADSARVAEFFGGGGHKHAAGFTVTGDYAVLSESVPSQVAELLKNMPD
jgi:phosphoesterase RecJ-like protein